MPLKLEFILLFVALVAFTYNYVHRQPITLSFDVKNPLTPEEVTLVAGAKTEIGPLKLSHTASWGKSLSSKLSFDLDIKPPKERWVDIQFTADSLEGILVAEGDVIEEGALIGFHSVEIQRQIEELQRKLAEEQDELIQAELQAKIRELQEENEVHALVSGWVRSLWVEQVEEELAVHLRVILSGAAPGGRGSSGGRRGPGNFLESP